MRYLSGKAWLFCLLVVLAPMAVAGASTKADSRSKTAVMTIEEIAALESVAAITRLAKARGIPFTIQTAETMQVRRIADFDEAKRLGAAGRVWVTFWVREEGDTVLVSFFFDAKQRVIGRQIKIETNNVP
jgi:outer membrane biosynthesis protein TonB